MKDFMFSDPNIPCPEKMKKIGCTQDSQCRSALQNMYGCDDMKGCPTREIPFAGGLAWTSAGIGAIQCRCGQNAHCDGIRCQMGSRDSYEEAGVVEPIDAIELYIGSRKIHRS